MCDHSLDYTVMFLEKMVIRVNVRQQFHNKSLNEDDGGITEKKISIVYCNNLPI